MKLLFRSKILNTLLQIRPKITISMSKFQEKSQNVAKNFFASRMFHLTGNSAAECTFLLLFAMKSGHPSFFIYWYVSGADPCACW